MSEDFVKFESINKDRAEDIIRRYPKNEYGVTRAEVILTNRCQLKCAYCQLQLQEMCEEQVVEHEVLKRTICQWLDYGCKFLHFTGGEATLCKHLPEYVEMASKRGADVTLSTNGVNDLRLYEELIRKGVNVFHISLDTMDPEVFDRQVGVDGSFEKVMQTIKLITRMRDEEHYRTKLVINTCITANTFDTVVDIVKFMLSLKPNDIKLIPIAQLKEHWEEYDEKYEREMKEQLISMIPEGEGFTMLRSRVRSLVKKSFRGYNDKRVVPPCYLSQDERTIDPEGNYYGCYINYREGAKPIGNINEDSFITQSEKLRKHMMNFTNSDICQKYCADITVMCNKYIDSKIRENNNAAYLEMGSVHVTRDEYGNKAYNLERLYEEGIEVPKACYINAKFLNYVFIDKHSEYGDLLRTLNSYNRNTGIRQWIIGQKADSELVNLCEEIYRRFKGKKVVVRSSTNAEDGIDKSYAGVFESILDVTDVNTMVKAISQVYTSKYSYLIESPDKVHMGIIVQEQIEADYAGVAFTANPISGEDEYVFNYTEGACEQVVSGKETSEIVLEKDIKNPRIGELPAEMSGKIIDALRKIETIYGEPVDVEWAVRGDELYILQARPITTVKKIRVTGENLYIDSLAKDELDQYDMSAIRKAHKKYMEKHYQVRKKALDAGLHFPHVGYFFYNKKTLNDDVFSATVPDSLIYKVVSENEIRTLDKKDVVSHLLGLGEEDHIVRLQQITITNACGNVSFTEEGNVYIEYIPGGFGGFLSGELPFSAYVTDIQGKILYKKEMEYTVKWVFDSEQRKFIRTVYDAFQYSLEEEIIAQLITIALKMHKVMENPRAEWEMEGNKVYLNDISFEGNSVKDDELIGRQLSAGVIEGEIRVIRDVNDMKAILRGRSIVPESEYYQAKRSDELKDFLQKHNVDPNKKYVFVCESAHPSLSLLMEHSAGFIFERGGMLSHLGIILRENHVPGILIENAVSIYRDGQYYKEENR